MKAPRTKLSHKLLPAVGDGNLALWRKHASGLGKIGLLTGCFDLLHHGHLDLILQADQICDCLIVAINMDPSVQRLKGGDRPIVPLFYRMQMLAALEMVDYVTHFPGDRVTSTIRQVRPHVWMKGGDYTLSTLNKQEVASAKLVKAEIAILERSVDVSTSAILKRL